MSLPSPGPARMSRPPTYLGATFRHEARCSVLLAGSNERRGALLPWQNLNFLPLPHGQGAYGPRRLSSIAVIAITSDGGRPS